MQVMFTFLVLVFLLNYHAVEGDLTPDEIIAKLDEAQDFLNSPEFVEIIERIEYLLGPLPEPGLADKVGIRNRFEQAYHFNFYGTRYWDRGIVWHKYLNGEVLVFIRKFQLVWKNLNEIVEKCDTKYRVAYDNEVAAGTVNGTGEKYFKGNCSRLQEDFSEDDTKQLELELWKSFAGALFLTLMDLAIACDMEEAQDYSIPLLYNGDKTYYKNIGLWKRIIEEYAETGDNLEEKMKLLQAHVSAVGTNSSYGLMVTSAFENITRKLATYPFTELYQADATSRHDFNHSFYEVMFVLPPDKASTSPAFCAIFSPFNFEFEDVVNGDYVSIIDETYFSGNWFPKDQDFFNDRKADFDDYFIKIEDAYETFLKIDHLPPNDPRVDDTRYWDGDWDWQITGNNELNIIHKATLGWSLLGSVLEEVRCYLNESYTMEKRQQVLDERKRFDWSKASLYMKISPTLYRPCNAANETDWVGTCTKENHEICMPIPYGKNQDPDSEVHGGLSLMKPQWVYMKINGQCKGIKTYVTQFKICQCGFRQDCGSDLGPNVNITCQFVENDLIRKQCRGSIAYPCKTHPFAPGEYHRTCATNYCDIKHNSCERYHPKVRITHEMEPWTYYD